jgi:hypothetical protein
MTFGVEIYNKTENEFLKKYPNYLLQAFAPFLFSKLNFLTSVDDDSELWKFIDTMQELRYEQNIKILGPFISEDEKKITEWFSQRVSDFTKEFFNFSTVARNSYTRSLISYRYIKNLFDKGIDLNKRHGTVLEIGPGCGYLGLMLTRSGFNYISTDITQSFYMYQHFLNKNIWSENFYEGAESDVGSYDFNSYGSIHIPWWHWVDEELELPELDLVVINHVLTEMHENSVRYLLSKIVNNHLIKKNKEPTYIFIEGFGNETFRSADSVVKTMDEYGFNIIENKSFFDDIGNIAATVAVFCYDGKHKKNKNYLPVAEYKNISTFIDSVRSIIKFLIGYSVGKRYQKRLDISEKCYLEIKPPLKVPISELDRILDTYEPNYNGTKDEIFLKKINAVF